MISDFSARDQALGYLYQTLYALWLLINGNEERELILEGLDDVVFEKDGSPEELLQLKHHSKPATLTDASPELWKTLRIWSSHVSTGTIKLDSTTLTLITTSTATDGSIAANLRPDNKRNSNEALSALVKVAQTSNNIALKSAFSAFLDLSTEDRISLVDSVVILDQSTNIEGTADLIKDRIKPAVSREHREGLYERLKGWWFKKVISLLQEDSQNSITAFEVYDRIWFIASQFHPNALPIDFLDAQPNSIDPASDNRLFVQQLRAIAVNNKRIEKAIIDYYRAFEQRSRWAREELLIGDELEQYEKKLIDEWERFALAIADDYVDNDVSEQQMQHIGRQIYKWVEQDADYRIRPNVTEHYVMRGSYQILADSYQPRVWWHPKFVERVAQLLGQEAFPA